jgi:hypothetical protein
MCSSPPMRKTLRVCPLLLAMLIGCRRDSLPTSPTAPGGGARALTFQTVIASKESRIASPTFVVITDSGSWRQFLIGAGLSEPAVSIDFTHEMAIVAATGTQNDSCKSVEIKSVVDEGGQLAVQVNDARLPPSCVCPPVVVNPVHIVKTERSAARPVFTTLPATLGSTCS